MKRGLLNGLQSPVAVWQLGKTQLLRWWHRLRSRLPLFRRETNEADEPHAVVLRVAMLLRGGMPAVRVWRKLGEESPDSVPGQIAAQISRGVATAEAIARPRSHTNARSKPDHRHGEVWPVIAAAWQIAEFSGAPLAASLERLSAALQALDRVANRRSVLLAGSRSTIRLVLALPPFALLLGWLMGFDPLSAFAGVGGALLLGLGTVLLLLGVFWAKALIARAEAKDLPSGLALELSAISLAGGASATEALRRVADVCDSLDARWVRLAELARAGPVRQILSESQSLGTAPGAALFRAAETTRGRAETEIEQTAERLAIRVLVPIGVCVLPAFIVLGVVPVISSMLGASAFGA